MSTEIEAENINEQNQVEVEYPKLDIVEVKDILVPPELLPATIPSLQRLKDAPYKFFVLIVSISFNEKFYKFYFLTDGRGRSLIDLEKNQMYYMTNSKVYRFPLSRHLLPKSLYVYSKYKYIRVNESNCNVIYAEISDYKTVSKTVKLSGSLNCNCHPTTLAASIVFNLFNFPDLFY
jgi:hypothetical protein